MVVVPSGVTSVGNYAFSNSSALRYVMFAGVKCTIGSNLLNNSPLAFLYCPWTSDITQYAIKNNIAFQLIEDKNVDYSNYVVDMENTSYYTTGGIAQVEKFVPLTLNYSFDSSQYSTLSNCKLVLTFTDSLTIYPNSILQNGVQVNIEGIDYNENELILPITAQRGTLQLSVTPVADGKMASSARVTYLKNGVRGSDTVGIICLDAPLLKVDAPSLTGESSFEITGVTGANETVLLKIGGISVGNATAKKDGTFSATVTIPGTPIHGTSYTLNAELQSDSTVSTSTTVVYNEDAPILTKFDMYYYGHDLKYLNLLDMQTKANPIWPSKPLKFVIHFDNADSVAEVFVTSTKNGVASRMQALPTGNVGEFIAEGFFEGTSTSYVPGTLNVLYSTKTTADEYSADLAKEELPDKWRDSTANVITNTDSQYKAQIILADGDEVGFEVAENVTLSDLRNALLPTEISVQSEMSTLSLKSTGNEDWEAVLSFINDLSDEYKDNIISNAEDLASSDEEQDVVAVIKDDTQDRLVYVFWDSAKDAFRTASIKFLGTNWVYENSIGVSWADSAAAWGFIANSANVVIHTYNNAISLDDAEADIRSSNLTPEQQAYALEKTKQLRWGYAATSVLRMAAAAAGYGFAATGNPLLGTLVSTILNTAANLADNYLDKSLAYYAAGGQGTYLKWILDPSGVVYDLDTNEPIQGVTASAYWIEYVEGDLTFWDTAPNDSIYGTLWDAAEYSQQNPLTTDSDGSYAWEVPEGWWRVKYEKDGYATVWSDWMTVPPVQTDVNIGMTSTTLVDYALTFTGNTSTSATVSLKNNTASSSAVAYVLAAYDNDGRMVTCSTASTSLNAGASTSLTVTYSSSDNVTVIKAFVLDSATNAPLRSAWSKTL